MPLSRLDFEIAQLSEATRHVAAGEQLVSDQRELLEDQRSKGLDTADSEKLLSLFLDTLAGWEAHRALIEDALVRLGHPSVDVSSPNMSSTR